MKVVAKAAALVAGVAAAVGASATAVAAPSGATVEDFRYYEAAVNVPVTPGAFTGGVSIRGVVKGETSVFLFFSKDTDVTCPDGTADVRSETIRTEEDATEPGPVTLDIDRRLLSARGEAVVDVIHTLNPGCGEPEVLTVFPAERVTLEVTGTSPRFRTGLTGTASSRGDFDKARVYSLSRDGTGSASVGTWVDSPSDAAFVKYAVEHFVRHRTMPEAPANAAPEGGLGALGSFSRSFDPPGGLGVIFEDAFVGVTVDPAPAKTETIWGSSIQVTARSCPDGAVGFVFREVFGAAPAEVTIARNLGSAAAAETVPLEEYVVDECTGQEVTATYAAPLGLDLTATGPAVRVRDTFFQITPGDGVERRHGWYVAREATGPVTLDQLTGPADLGSISRASR